MRIQRSNIIHLIIVAALFVFFTAAITQAADPVLTVNKDGIGNGTIRSAPSGINCSTDCTTANSTFKNNRKVTLRVTPDTNSTFLGWSGGNCKNAGKCTVTMSADTTVTATFGQPDIAVSDESKDFGSVSTKAGKRSQSTVTVTNSGTGILKITSIRITGTDKSQFKLGSAAKTSVSSNGQGQIKVTFKPTKVGEKTAELIITSNDPDTPTKTVSLTGSGITAASKTTITGSVFASSVSDSQVSVKNTGGHTIAGPVVTAADGTYSIDVPTLSLSSDLIFESQDGTFTDEATSTTTTAGIMSTFIEGGSLAAGSSVNITPFSTIANDLISEYGLTLDDAQTAFNSAFGFSQDDVSVVPANTPLTDTDTDTKPRLAFIRAAAFSQLTKDLGLTPDKQFELLAALAQDLADGTPDGKDASGSVSIETGVNMPEDIQNMYEQSMVSVLGNTSINLTGMTAGNMGDLSFAKVALTDTYLIEYLPGMMAAAQGKTSFKLKVTKLSDGSAATGLTISLMPKMHMATKSHSTPADTVIDNGDGTYSCTVYYLMASGPGMGFWELIVTIGSGMSGESAIFYPQVAMAMGTTTVRATLKGQADTITGSMGASKRSYYLFNDGSTTTTSFNLFIAANESMMSYPAVSEGTTLHDAASTAWTVSPITVSVSTDNITWVSATDNTGGHWTVSGLTGLSSGQTGTIYVKLTVNGEQKTTDGNALSDTNGYASFTVTP